MNPSIIACTAETWIKVATGVVDGVVYAMDRNKYYYTYRITGDVAPVGFTDALYFEKSFTINYKSPVDIYVVSRKNNGSVRVDLQSSRTGINTIIVTEQFHKHTGVNSTIAANSNIGDIQIQVVSDLSFNVGDNIQINGSNLEPSFPVITGKPGGNILQLDRPLDHAHIIGNSVEQIQLNLKTTAGTLASPVEYFCKPDESNKIWFIQRLFIQMVHATQGTDDKFGNVAALTNGIVVRTYIDGVYETIANWKTNGDMRLSMFDVSYNDKAGSSLFGTSGRWILSSVAIRLDGSKGDYISIIIQDNLTTLTSLMIAGQGYEE